MKRLYLDHAATTPLHPEVQAHARRRLRGAFAGNPSSRHAEGRAARARLEAARARLAAVLGCAPESLIFTAGGTEANNLALFGLARRAGAPGRRLAASAIEHPSVLNPLAALEAEGGRLVLVPVDRAGRVARERLAAALTDDTALAAVMHANNEVGTVQDLALLGAVCAARGVPLHADMVQSLRWEPIDLAALPVATASFSAHKVGGGSGVGALYVRPGVELCPHLLGGGQERDLRPGTEHPDGAELFALAVELAARERSAARARVAALVAGLRARVRAAVPELCEHTPPAGALPHVWTVSVRGLRGVTLVELLDEAGVAVSSGSACGAGHDAPSHVLRALGADDEQARGAVRFSPGPELTEDDLDRVAGAFAAAVAHLRALAPAAESAEY